MSHTEVQMCLGKWVSDANQSLKTSFYGDIQFDKYHEKYLKDLKKAIYGILSAKYARKVFKVLKKHLNGVYIDKSGISKLDYFGLHGDLLSAVQMTVHQLNVKYSRKCFKSLNKHILKIDGFKGENIYHMRFAHLKYDAYAVLTDIKDKRHFMDYRNYKDGSVVKDIITEDYQYFVFLKEHDPDDGFYDNRIFELSVDLPGALNNGTLTTRKFKGDNEVAHLQMVDFITYQLQEQLSDLVQY